jgi:hypothetical protein
MDEGCRIFTDRSASVCRASRAKLSSAKQGCMKICIEWKQELNRIEMQFIKHHRKGTQYMCA